MEHTESVRETIAGFVYGHVSMCAIINIKSACRKPSRPKWMPEMPKGLESGKEGFFTPLIFV